jgi:plasmid maintenance system antidote protein VapI
VKYKLGRCMLRERLDDAGMASEDLAERLMYKPERLSDYMDNKRIMPLSVALSIADTLGCEVRHLYELKSAE